MRWLSINTWNYRKQRKECWHKWFTWFPVVIKRYPDGAVERVWLQYVKRKGELHGWWDGSFWEYEYKLLD